MAKYLIGQDLYGGDNPRYKNLFSYGGNLYVFLADASANPLPVGAHKSTDSGATWSSVGTPGLAMFHGFASYACVRIGDVVYVVASPNDVDALDVQPFDLTTDTWGTKKRGGPDAFGVGFGLPIFFCAAKSNGDIRVFYITSGGVLKYATYSTSTSTWSANAAVPGVANTKNTPAGIGVDSADRVHLIYLDMIASGDNLYHVAVDSSGTFGTPQLIVSSIRKDTVGGGKTIAADLMVDSTDHVHIVAANYYSAPEIFTAYQVLAYVATAADTPSFSASTTLADSAGPGWDSLTFPKAWFEFTELSNRDIVAYWTMNNHDGRWTITTYAKRSSGGSWGDTHTAFISEHDNSIHEVYGELLAGDVVGVAISGDDDTASTDRTTWYTTFTPGGSAPPQAQYLAF